MGSVPQKMQDGSDPCCSGRSHYFLLEWLGNKMSSVYTRSSMHFWPLHEAFADTKIRNQAKFYSLDLSSQRDVLLRRGHAEEKTFSHFLFFPFPTVPAETSPSDRVEQ